MTPEQERPEPAKPLIEFPQALWDDLAKVDQALAAKEAKAVLEPDGRFVVDFLMAPHVVDPAARLVTACRDGPGPTSRRPWSF